MKCKSILYIINYAIISIFVLIFSIDQLIHAILDIPALMYMAMISIFTVTTLISLYILYRMLENQRGYNHAY